MPTTLTAKGQVTIPKPLRDMLGLRPGSQVTFRRTAEGQVVLEPASETKPGKFAQFRGHAGKGLSTDQILSLTRGEA